MHNFSTQLVFVVLRILNTCVLLFCVVSVFGLFVVFNLWIGPGLIFKPCS